MSDAAKILLIEDDPGIVVTLRRVLRGGRLRGPASRPAATPAWPGRASDALDVVITDMRVAGPGRAGTVRELHAAKPRLPIILMTAHGTTETAIEATKLGAYDYLLKPLRACPSCSSWSPRPSPASRLMTEPVELGAPGATRDALVGNSRAMQDIYKEIGRVAAKPVNVLIRGETGTGKELIARAIYQHSDRAKAPFIAINCAAIPETLLESELFGHERGAFTGAENRRIGRFEQADHGTIFLDEIGDMTPGTQVKLLRVLAGAMLPAARRQGNHPRGCARARRHAPRPGSGHPHKQFREDLYYRLSVVVIQLPPLRERREDIPELVKYFLRKYAAELGVADPSIHADAMDFLQTQNWPGNVRELENVIRKVLLLAQGYTINLDHVRAALARTARARRHRPPVPARTRGRVARRRPARRDLADAHARLLKAAEREIFTRAIELAHGNQAKAARWLGISRLTMREKLHQFGIHPAQDRTQRSGTRVKSTDLQPRSEYEGTGRQQTLVAGRPTCDHEPATPISASTLSTASSALTGMSAPPRGLISTSPFGQRLLANAHTDREADQLRVLELHPGPVIAVVEDHVHAARNQVGIDLFGALHHGALGRDVQRRDAHRVGRHADGPDDAVVVVALFDDRLHGARDPDAVATHDRRLLLARFVEEQGVERLAVPWAGSGPGPDRSGPGRGSVPCSRHRSECGACHGRNARAQCSRDCRRARPPGGRCRSQPAAREHVERQFEAGHRLAVLGQPVEPQLVLADVDGIGRREPPGSVEARLALGHQLVH